MRIVAGKWKGRKLHELSGKVLASELRPTLDRVRETIFNILTHGIHYEVKGARVLDLFCGTGALGFEALSRGASCACLIDNEKSSLSVASENKNLFKAGKEVNLLKRDATKLNQNSDQDYNLVFLDPPYGRFLGEVAINQALQKGWISKGAIIVWEENDAVCAPKELIMIRSKKIGKSCINFLKRCE